MFCNLESRNFTSKIIPKIQKDDGTLITKQNEILSETHSFYQNLYSEQTNITDVNLSELIINKNTKKLTNEPSENLEGFITKQEASDTLRSKKSNKSPGSSGFTPEFFKMFWIKLDHFIVRSINYAYNTGELSVTQKLGLITCIPKGDKSRSFLKNWRPLSLLNTVYKIASGAIASRFKSVLHYIINNDQTGFIQGRFIGENTRLMYDIMNYAEENNIPGLLLLVDFEKAFDTVSWSFIQKVLQFFNFGPSIQRWIKVFQTNISSLINQSGHLSD